MESNNQWIETMPFWEKLSETQQNMLIKASIVESFNKGRILNRTDEECKGMIILKSGQIRVYMLSDEGREVTLYRLHKGDICVLSASCLLDSITFDVVIEVVEGAETILVPSGILHQVIEQNPYMELFLQRQANERFSDVMWTMQQLLFMRMDRRVAIFLWDEISTTKQNILAYTHDEVARFIESAREVVTRVLKYFVQEGVLKLSRGKIEIIDKDKLKSYL